MKARSSRNGPIHISLITGSMDPHYQLDLLSGLAPTGLIVDVIGSDSMEGAEVFKGDNIHFFNLRGDQNPDSSLLDKMIRVLKYYLLLMRYVVKTDSKLFHIQWPNKFVIFDRTILNILYRALGKKLVFTAHNVDAQKRDSGKSSLLNQFSLRFMYQLMDRIIVHTDRMRGDLVDNFQIDVSKIAVIPHGINTAVPKTDIVRPQARERLGLKAHEKVLLFFGNIAPYKGVEYAVLALGLLREKYEALRLVIAGRTRGHESYWKEIENIIQTQGLEKHVIKKREFIPDEHIEFYYKAADVLLLPYKHIFQSGVLFLSYSFGLPVVASDVGSLREDIIEGKTGFVCRPGDARDLADKIEHYFNSDVYTDLELHRQIIIDHAMDKYSWRNIGQKTFSLYQEVLAEP